MRWRVVQPIRDLFDQWNAAAPARSRLSDGTLGDAAHAARKSDHNPDAAGWVRAGDVTHDPADGADVHAWIRHLIAGGPPGALKYAISSRGGDPRHSEIWTPARGWHPYTGANRHNRHCHISVKPGYEFARVDWRVRRAPAPTVPPAPVPAPAPTLEVPEMKALIVVDDRDGSIWSVTRDDRRRLDRAGADLERFIGWAEPTEVKLAPHLHAWLDAKPVRG